MQMTLPACFKDDAVVAVAKLRRMIEDMIQLIMRAEVTLDDNGIYYDVQNTRVSCSALYARMESQCDFGSRCYPEPRYPTSLPAYSAALEYHHGILSMLNGCQSECRKPKETSISRNCSKLSALQSRNMSTGTSSLHIHRRSASQSIKDVVSL